MIPQLMFRMIREVSPRILFKFFHLFLWKGMRAMQHWRKRQKQGRYFPPFWMISLTDQCNLHCQGCWITPLQPPRQIAPENLDKIVSAVNQHGGFFFGLLGGEPLLYPQLWDWVAKHTDCYFQLFTNGTLLTQQTAQKMRELGNITPLISIEGLNDVSDIRRGGVGVYPRAMQAIEYCHKARLVTGVATSVCRSNFEQVVNEKFIRDLICAKVHYVWYYIYRPMGARATKELALTKDQILFLRRFLVKIRSQVPMIVIDAYWSAQGRALCPGAVGLSHHIGPGGDIEFCPILQFAHETIPPMATSQNFTDMIENSKFLQQLREFCNTHTSGCILLESPQLLGKFLQQSIGYDTSGRGTFLTELEHADIFPSHHIPGQEIPEEYWLYRWAKQYGLFGWGGYG